MSNNLTQNEIEKLFRFLTDESKEKILNQLKNAKTEGKNEGIEIGKRVANMETAKNLIKLGISFDNIAEATKLDLLEIKALATAM